MIINKTIMSAVILMFFGIGNLVLVNDVELQAQQMQSAPEVRKTQDMPTPPPTNPTQIEFKTIDGEVTSLAAYARKVKLVVNVASKCGYTPQYQGLEDLFRKYKEMGLVVIGFPANNFGGQEPGTNEEIKEFCESKYDVTFPMMSKISVKGEDIHPLYAYLTSHSEPSGEIGWNFNKFLLDRDNNIIARWPSKVEPTSDEIAGKIEILLKQEAQKE